MHTTENVRCTYWQWPVLQSWTLQDVILRVLGRGVYLALLLLFFKLCFSLSIFCLRAITCQKTPVSETSHEHVRKHQCLEHLRTSATPAVRGADPGPDGGGMLGPVALAALCVNVTIQALAAPLGRPAALDPWLQTMHVPIEDPFP